MTNIARLFSICVVGAAVTSACAGAGFRRSSVTATSAQDGRDRYEATIRRTSYGIPHIEAANLASLGFGEGYAQAEDHLCTIADQVVEARGERAKYLGPGEGDRHLHSDIVMKALRVRERAGELQSAQPQEIRDWLEGLAAGYNRYLEQTGKDAVPGWCRGQDWVFPITSVDLAAVNATPNALVGPIATAQPPGVGASNAPASPDGDAGDLVVGGSNGWALGRTLTENGRGMLLANPHAPWLGSRRFWEKHLSIPGDLDVYGVSAIGQPGVLIGFNNAVAWTVTNSPGVSATVYAVALVPGDPTRYRYGGEERRMTPIAVSVDVRGMVEPVERTVWFTHYGPVITRPALPWTTERAFTIRDANLLSGGPFTQRLAMNRAPSMAALKKAHAEHQALASINIIATSADGAAWYIDANPTPNLSPAAIAAWLDRRENDALTRQRWQNAGEVLLDGSDPTFEWRNDPDARRPGIVPFRHLPQLERTDYVFNANDSFWFANAHALLEGDYSPLHGEQRAQLSLRTRNNALHVSNAAPYAPGDEDGKFSLLELQRAVLSNHSLTADVLVPGLVERCKTTPHATVEGRDVDLTRGCVVLSGWDRRFDLASRGAALFREWIGQYENRDFEGSGRLFAVDFDPADPLNTPRGLAAGSVALENLGKAVRILESRSIALDVPLGELQYAPSKLPERIATHGGSQGEGVLNVWQGPPTGLNTTLEPVALPPPVAGSRFLTEGGYPIVLGSSFLMALEYRDDGPRAMAFLTYSQSGDPNSEHFRDQTELFARKQWRPILFHRDAIAADVKREYTVSAPRK